MCIVMDKNRLLLGYSFLSSCFLENIIDLKQSEHMIFQLKCSSNTHVFVSYKQSLISIYPPLLPLPTSFTLPNFYILHYSVFSNQTSIFKIRNIYNSLSIQGHSQMLNLKFEHFLTLLPPLSHSFVLYLMPQPPPCSLGDIIYECSLTCY